MPLSSPYLSKHPILMILSVAPAWLAAIVLAVSFHPAIHKRLARWQLPLTGLLYVVTRLLLYWLIYVALGDRQIAGDVRWFQWEGRGALEGKLPYRDFACWHSPLFPYLMAIPYGLWEHISSGVLAFIVFDALCLLLLCKLAGRDRALDAAWVWTVNPAVWMIVVRYGQDESVIAACLLLAAYLYARGSKWWNPVALALGVLFTKATTAVGMAVVYTYSSTKIRDASIVAVISAAVCVPLILSGADVLQPLVQQKTCIEGVSATCLLDRLLTGEESNALLAKFATMASLVLVVGVAYASHRRGLPVLEGLAACLIAFLVTAPVSYKFYRLWFLGPLGLHALRTNRMGRFALYSALLCTFDDFSFKTDSPRRQVYLMALLAAAIIYFEMRYLVEILQRRTAEANQGGD